MHSNYDVAIIGSGFGGSVLAARLSKAGRSVVVLERGRRWKKDDFPRTTGQVADAFWKADGTQGFLEYRSFKRVDIIQGVGVGGGSLHYFNVNLRAPERIFQSERWPSSVDLETLKPYYASAEHILESRPFSPPEGRTLPRRTEAFMRAAKRANRSPELVNIAVYTGSGRQNPHGGTEQEACVYCGNCMLGCHVHAKNTLDLTYLGAAERRYGAEIRPLHEATCITPQSDNGGFRVDVRLLVEHSGEEIDHILARNVVVAAGVLGSTELLLRCRDVHQTLPKLGRALGRYFSTNGDLLLGGAWGTKEAIDPGHGPSITAAVDCSTTEDIITIEDLGFPDPLLWFLEGRLPPPGNVILHQLKRVSQYMWQRFGIGRGSRVHGGLDVFLGGARTTNFLPYLGMGTDAGNGELVLHGDRIDVKWNNRQSRRMFKAMERAMIEISEAAGGRYSPGPLWRWPMRKLLTAHPLGGCIMGDDPAKSVVDHRGQVWDYPGLYVCDGAVISTALAVNPSLTIAALAERTAQWMLHDRDLERDDIQGL